MTIQILRPKARAYAQLFLYVPLPAFGCLPLPPSVSDCCSPLLAPEVLRDCCKA
jgi:hypothetical protein